MHFMQSKASHRAASDRQAAQCLGWTSIAIGLTEILAPNSSRKRWGWATGRRPASCAVLGVREIMHGIDILAHEDPTPGVWSRVFGDLLDSLLLGAAATRTKNPGGLAAIFAAVTPVVLADLILAPRLSKDKAKGQINA